MHPTTTRRNFLGTLTIGTSGLMAHRVLAQTPVSASVPVADPRISGPFPILSTPYHENGEVDYETLAREARFVDWCGSPGMIWPQSGDSIDLLTQDEKLKGMSVLAETMRGRQSALCLGVQGKNTEEMLVYARHAEKLNPAAIISRPPDEGKTEADLRAYWRALAEVAQRPVIIQTTGGTTYKGQPPSTKLLIELGRDFPHFGYVKEEANPVLQRMRELLAAKPAAIRRVWSAWGGWAWLHQARFGTEGVITERAAYADLLARIWGLMKSGADDLALMDAFSKYLLIINIRETIHGGDLRGPHLYVFQKRGVFKNRVSREYGPKNSIPAKPIVSELKLGKQDTDEIDRRLEAIKPYLQKGVFNPDA